MLEVQIGLVAAAWLVGDLNEVIFAPSEAVTIAEQGEVVDSGRAEGVAVDRAGVFVGRWLVADVAVAVVVVVGVVGIWVFVSVLLVLLLLLLLL